MFVVNYLANVVLINELLRLGRVKAQTKVSGPSPRIVVVSSGTYVRGESGTFGATAVWNMLDAVRFYGQSKYVPSSVWLLSTLFVSKTQPSYDAVSASYPHPPVARVPRSCCSTAFVFPVVAVQRHSCFALKLACELTWQLLHTSAFAFAQIRAPDVVAQHGRCARASH